MARPERRAPAATRAAEATPAVAAALLLAGAAVAALSGSDEREVRLGPLHTHSTCPLRRLTGRRCPGCGMTRALALLLRGKPVRATRTNPAAIPMLVLLAGQLRGPRLEGSRG